jgi:hypothetical protein
MKDTSTRFLLPKPGAIRRKFRDLAARHWAVRVLMRFVDLVFRLDIGLLQVTVETRALVNPATIRHLLRTHRRCDWGEVSAFQRRFNDTAFSLHRGTIHSTYTAEGREVHVLTFGCRCSRWIRRRTLVCLKSELHVPFCGCVWKDCPLDLRPRHELILPLGVRDALKSVLSYLWCEEVDSYQSSNAEQRKTHILKFVSIVTDWLFGQEESPTDVDQAVKLIQSIGRVQ